MGDFSPKGAKLLGNLLISDQTNASRAGRAVQDRVYGRPAAGLAPLLAEIRACTPEAVQATAAEYVAEETGYEVILGP